MKKLRYVVYEEDDEISVKDFDKYNGDITDAAINNGLKNGRFDVKGIYDSFEKAKNSLDSFYCTYDLRSGHGNVKFYYAKFYYIEEEMFDEDNEEWYGTGNYEFAKIEN